jgi:hypothetical protein
MKYVLTLVTGLLLCCTCIAQDQVKTQYSNKVIEGRIFELETYYLKIRLPDLVERKIIYESIDSIYTSRDSLRKKMRFNKGTRDKLTKTRLVGPSQELRSISKFDTISSDPKELAKTLAVAQVNILRIKERNKNAGRSLSAAGSLLMIGSISAVVGSILAVNGSPKGGVSISVFGGVIGLVGYGKLVKSGNLLQGTSGKELNVGLEGNRVGLHFKF